MNKRDIIIESLKQNLAITQNHLENAKSKYTRAKTAKDYSQIITYRNMKKRLEKKIKDIAGVLKEYE